MAAKKNTQRKEGPTTGRTRRITLIWRENGKFKSQECELDEGEVLHVHDALNKDDPNHDIYLIT